MKPVYSISVKMQPMIDNQISTDCLELEPSWPLLLVVVVAVVVAQRAGY